MQLPRSSPSQSGWTLSQTRCYWAGVASVTRNVCLTEPTPGSASHLVPITPLITHVSGCLGSSGGNACWGEEARLLLTVGDDTGCPVCSLGPEWSPGAEQSRGLENKEPGDMAKKGAQGGCREGQHQAPGHGNKQPPPHGVGRAMVRDQRELGLHPCNLLLCDAGQVTLPLRARFLIYKVETPEPTSQGEN